MPGSRLPMDPTTMGSARGAGNRGRIRRAACLAGRVVAGAVLALGTCLPAHAVVPAGSYCLSGLGSSTGPEVDGWLAIVDPAGAVTPLALTPDPGLVNPWDCAVDPTTGDVIVVDEGPPGPGADGSLHRVVVDMGSATGSVTTLMRGTLVNPRGLVVDGAGVIYLTDVGPLFGGSNDAAVYSFGAGATLTRLDTGGPALDDPVDVDVDPRPFAGTSPGVNLIVLDRTGRLDRVPLAGGDVVTLDSLGGSAWWGSFEVGPMGKYFLVDFFGGDVVRWDRDTGNAATLEGTGGLGLSVDYFTGDLVVADTFGGQVQNVPPNANLPGAPGASTLTSALPPGFPAGISFSPPLPRDTPSANFGVPTRRAPAGTTFMNMGPTAGVENGDTEFEHHIFIEVSDTSRPLQIRIFDANSRSGYDEPRTGGFDSRVDWALYDPAGAIVTQVSIPPDGRVDLDQRIATLNAGNTLTVRGPGIPLSAAGLYRLEMRMATNSDVNQYGVWVEDFHAYTFHAGFGPLDTIASSPVPRATTLDPARLYPYQERGCEFTTSNYDMDLAAGTSLELTTRLGERFTLTGSGFTVHAEDGIDPAPGAGTPASIEMDQGMHRLEVEISPTTFGDNNLVTLRLPDFQGWSDDDGPAVDAPVPPGATPVNPTPVLRSSPSPAWPPAGPGANTFLRMYLPGYDEVPDPVPWASRDEPSAPYLTHAATPLAGDPPQVGLPSTYAVTVQAVNPDPVHGTGPLTLTVPVPAPALYVESAPNVSGPATATGGGLVTTCGAAPCSGSLQVVWPAGIAPASAESFSYAVQVTPSLVGERLYLTGGPPFRGGGATPAPNPAPAPGTTARFTPAWSSATFPRTESLGPLCDLSVVEGTVTPVSVELARLEARSGDGEVLLIWETASEVDNLGFRVHRRLEGESQFQLRTPTLILGRGTTDLRGRYAFHDTTVPNGVRAEYLVEDIEFDGDTGWHGPVVARAEAGAPALEPDAELWDGFAAAAPASPATRTASVEAASGTSGSSSGPTSGTEPVDPSAAVQEESRSSAPLEGPELTVLESSSRHLVVDVALPPVASESISVAGSRWTRVRAPGFDLSVEPGHPELPAATFWLPAPALGTARVELLEQAAQLRALDAPVIPVPTPVLEGGQTMASLAPDPSIYQGEQLVPDVSARVVALVRNAEGQSLVGVRLHPARFVGASNELEVASHMRLRIEVAAEGDSVQAAGETLEDPGSRALYELARQDSIEILTRGAGLFQVEGAELLAAGLDPGVDPRSLQLSLEGEPLAIALEGEDDGRLDPGDRLLFYSPGYEDRYTDTAVHRLVAERDGALRAPWLGGAPTTGPDILSIEAVQRFEEQSLYLPTVLNGEGDNFVGDFVFSQPVTSHVPSPASRAEAARLRVRLRGGTSYEAIPDDHHMTVRVDGEVVLDAVFDGTELFEAEAPIPASALGEDMLEVAVHPEFDSGAPFDLIYVDALELVYRRAPELRAADEGQLEFDAEVPGPTLVRGLADPGRAQVWEIRDAAAPRRIGDALASETGLRFEALAGRRYRIVDGGRARRPHLVRADRPSDWTDPSARHGADWVAIAHGNLLEELEPLAAQRRAQGLTTALVDVDDVYDEMSGGRMTPLAIRDFVRRISGLWSPAPRYLLLVGDASYDYRDFLGGVRTNLVPTLLVDTTFVEAASDSALARLDEEDEAPDLAVGRLPVETPEQLRGVVAKLLAYENEPDGGEAWRRRALLVADDGLGAADPVEQRAFEDALDRVAGHAPPSFELPRVMLSALADATEGDVANREIRGALGSGAAMAIYAGHGGSRLWADELIFGADDFDTLANPHLPLFVVLNCLNGFFDAPNEESLGEVVLETPDRGGIGMISSTTVSAFAGQDAFVSALARRILQQNERRVGDAMRHALGSLADLPGAEDVQRSYVLLGDPATRLAMPQTPVADAGTSREVRVAEGLRLDGSGSHAPGGGPLHYAWRVVEEPRADSAILIDRDDPARPTFVGLAPGLYALELTVRDAAGNPSAPDRLLLSVTPDPSVLGCGGPDATQPPPRVAGGDAIYLLVPLLASFALRRRVARSRSRASA